MNRRKFIFGSLYLGASSFLGAYSLPGIRLKEHKLPPFIPQVRHGANFDSDQLYRSLFPGFSVKRERFYQNGFSSSVNDLKKYDFKIGKRKLTVLASDKETKIIDMQTHSKTSNETLVTSLLPGASFKVKKRGVVLALKGSASDSYKNHTNESKALLVEKGTYLRANGTELAQLLIISV